MSERLSELLPWYVNGSLNDEDRNWVQAQLRERPETALEAQWLSALQTQLRAAVPEVSDEIGLDRALARIEVVKRDARLWAPASRKPAPAEAGRGLARLRAWFDGLGVKPAMALAWAVIAVQAVLLARFAMDAPASSEIRAVGQAGTVEQGPYLKINFKGDATEADIRLLLVQERASLAGGPGQLGDYYVRVPAGRAEAAAARLKTNRIVDAVAVVDGLPGKD